jgi:CubicO group peptidase (beta-lactamase class C family)
MSDLSTAIGELAVASDFCGVASVVRKGDVEFAEAFGLAHRGYGIANTVETRFGIASATKGLTALAVVSLIAEGRLALETTARSVLGSDLPLIDPGVTIEHLLAHRSGIGDYLDEDGDLDITDYPLPIGVHRLAETEDFLGVLDGFATKSPPGRQFAYNNGGYVVLALIAERIGGAPFRELVQRRVCEPAGMADTQFLRSDALPGRTATGYMSDDRTNIFHLPVRGSGDGGIYSTAADFAAFWPALFADRIVPAEWVSRMVAPVSTVPRERRRYGLGFWLAESGDVVLLEGYDAGVSFRSVHQPQSQTTYTVLSNTTEGAWPVARLLRERLGF